MSNNHIDVNINGWSILLFILLLICLPNISRFYYWYHYNQLFGSGNWTYGKDKMLIIKDKDGRWHKMTNSHAIAWEDK